jgi:hypothetical protein
MTLYFCEYCNLSTKIKTHYVRHLKTKKHIKNEGCLYNNSKKKYILAENEHKMNTNRPKMNTNEHKFADFKTINSKKNECNYCSKTFNTIASKRRHELHFCKKADKTTILFNELKQQKDQYEKEKQELKKHIELLLNKVGNTTNNTTINNTILLNNYGQEDISHISDSIKTQLLKIPYGMIPKMIEYIHFNNNKPENKNIMLTNSRDNKLKIFKDNKWVYKDKNETINNMIDTKYGMLDSHFDTYQEKQHSNIELSEHQHQNYKKFRELIDTSDKSLIENIKKDCEIILLNNR